MKSKTKNYIFIFLLIITFSVMSLTGTTRKISFYGSSTQMTFTGPDNKSTTIDFSDIISLEFLSDPDYGTAINGGTLHKCMYGIWDSPSFGTYHAYIDPQYHCCVLIQTNSEVIAFNYESDETTKAFFENYSAYLFGNVTE